MHVRLHSGVSNIPGVTRQLFLKPWFVFYFTQKAFLTFGLFLLATRVKHWLTWLNGLEWKLNGHHGTNFFLRALKPWCDVMERMLMWCVSHITRLLLYFRVVVCFSSVLSRSIIWINFRHFMESRFWSGRWLFTSFLLLQAKDVDFWWVCWHDLFWHVSQEFVPAKNAREKNGVSLWSKGMTCLTRKDVITRVHQNKWHNKA